MGQMEFDFREFIAMPRDNPDFVQPFPWPFGSLHIHEKAVNAPKTANLYSVVGNRIELGKEQFPTRRGWKTLNNLLGVYRDKRFETARYLLVDNRGIIRDHAAVTSYSTNRCKIAPDDFSGEKFIGQVKEQAVHNSCKIIFIHNHPSGVTEPSNEDIDLTKSFEKSFGKLFAGHIILDHGTFGLCLPGKDFETVTLPIKDKDPLVKPDAKAYLGLSLTWLSDEKVSILRNALQVDGIHSWNDADWVPVVFANNKGVTQALHYYETSEFTGVNASKFIVDKTITIGRQCGAIWAFPVTDNQDMLEPISRITRETGIFRDFYIGGTMGYTMGLGGSLTKHFPLNTNYASTFPVFQDASPAEDKRKAAGEALADGAEKKQEEKAMEKLTPEGKTLNREQHAALVEFLDSCSSKNNEALMTDYMREITGIREFRGLEDFLPPYDNGSWEMYREELRQAHGRELRSYTERFPFEPLHESASLPCLFEEGGRVMRTPLDFLTSCRDIGDARMYREIYGNDSPFPQGSVKAVSPQKIALFHEGASLPLVLLDNTPENWAKLYTRANDNGINVNGIIPAPDEIEILGTGMLRVSEDRLRNAMSKEGQEGEFRKDFSLARSMAGEAKEAEDKHPARDGQAQRKFVQFPYVRGAEVPSFALEEDGKLVPYSGFAFDAAGGDGKSVILTKHQAGKPEEQIAVSSKLYAKMIANAKRAVNREEPQRETVTRFEKMMEKDADERRPNRAADFWHNYKILCRQQASNPQEAMEVACSIVRQMPKDEQVKLRRSLKAYETATKPLVSNPLLRAFVKPRETYNQRILAFYEESVRDLPIKNRSPHGHEALAPIKQGRDNETPGMPIDPALKLKIGDTVKLSLQCKTLFGESRKQLPVTPFTVVSASKDLNKIVLLDKTGRTKYTLAMDDFIEKTQKLERKLDRKRQREDRYESVRY
jgi:proteasome lid subunit RPN8/RPN11